MPLIQGFIDARPMGVRSLYRAAEALADAHARAGHLDMAVSVLEHALALRQTELLYVQSAAYTMRLELQLAALERRRNRAEHAAAIESRMSALLENADPEFQTLIELNRLRIGTLSRTSAFARPRSSSAIGYRKSSTRNSR